MREDQVETPSEDEAEDEQAEAEEETSLDEIIAKKSSEDDAEDEAEDESVLTLEPEERVGSLPSKVKPQQSSEFTCRNCFLVKSKSQLADRKRMLCRDCA